MSVIIKLDKSKLKMNDMFSCFKVDINHNIGARIMDMSNSAKHGLVLEIKKYYPKRSKESNKKMWALCSDIAEELSKEFKTTKEDVYRNSLRDGNEYQDVDIENSIIAERIRMWASKGVGWFSEEMYPAQESGKTTVRQYFGSSSYNSRQMSALIRRLLDDAESMGMEITDPAIMALLDDADRR